MVESWSTRAGRTGRGHVTLIATLGLALALLPIPLAAEPLSLQISSPADRELVLSVPLVEIRGYAGLRPPSHAVILLDQSISTLVPVGFDVDGDGKVGTLRAHSLSERMCSDPGDTVARVAIQGATAVARWLTRRAIPTGLITFAESPRLGPEVGEPAEVLRVLRRLGRRQRGRGTNLHSAIRAAVRALPPSSASENPWIVLISDGIATKPNRAYADRLALKAVEQAASRGVRIYAFSPGAEPASDLLEEMTRRTGGELTRFQGKHEIAALLGAGAPGSLDRVTLANMENGARGVAVRLFADGSFDGYLPLVSGSNTLRIRATLTNGKTLTAQRRIRFEPRAPRNRVEEAKLNQLHERARLRTLETELALTVSRPRLPSRSLEIHLESQAPVGESGLESRG